MSAIFGIVRFDGAPVRTEELSGMAASLAAHGGDGSGQWLHRNVGLGHLLRIVTPEDRFEQQPVVNAAYGARLLFCGRLDNRAELLAKFAPMSAPSAQVPDSHLVSAAFQRWGPDCADRLYGDFVVAVWQPHERRLTMVRGPMSDRTIFYFWDGSTFAFATSPIGLFALPFVPRELDRARLAEFARRMPVAPGSSFFRGISTVPGGAITKVDAEGPSNAPYWSPSSLPDIRLKSDEEYVEALREIFDRAVEARLRSAFPMAAMMSGGIDSAAVACTAAGILSKSDRRLLAFTQVPREPSDELAGTYYNDERPLVQSIARMYRNIDLNLVFGPFGDVLGGHAAFLAAAGAPFRNMGNRPWMEEILHQASVQGARAILTGAAGNVAFSWSGKGVLPDLLRGGRLASAWRHAQAMKSKSTLRTFIGKGLVPLLPEPLWRAVMRRAFPDDSPNGTSLSPLRREFVHAQQVREREAEGDVVRRPERNSRLARERMLRQSEVFGAEIQCGLEARHGVEQRDPTSDRRLVEFCLSIPEAQFQRAGESRSLPRRAMANRWPPEVSANRRRGLQNSDWRPVFLASLPELRMALDRLSESPLSVEILDFDRMREVLDGAAGADHEDPKTYAETHLILYLGLGLGQFFEWIESPDRSGLATRPYHRFKADRVLR